MSYKPRYERGDWNAICDVCGRQFKASLLRKRWDGYMVCPDDFEHRQPQDFVRGVADKQLPPFVRDEPADNFVKICTPEGMSALFDSATFDCVRFDYIHPAYDPYVGVLPNAGQGQN